MLPPRLLLLHIDLGGSHLQDYRLDPSNNRIVILNALKGNQNNAICPIKWILVNALRTDNVEATSITELLASAKAHNKTTIRWKQGNLPLLYCRDGLSKASQRATPYEDGALISVLRNVLDKASGLAGITKKLTTQALRRGGAQDVYMLKDKVQVSNLEVVGASLGHTPASTVAGVTNKYINNPGVDFWSARVKNQYDDPFGPEIVESTFVPPRVTTEEVNQVCKEESIDPGLLASRKKAARVFRKRARDEWEGRRGGLQIRLEHPPRSVSYTVCPR